MKRGTKVKKKFKAILACSLALLLTACGNGSITSTLKSKSLSDNFKTEATIEETVLYDENGIKITATALNYKSFSAELALSLQNNTEKNLSFVCGSMGYSVNSVNGYMIQDGYLNCDVAPGETSEQTLSISVNTMLAYGITEIADMEIGFDISDEEYNSNYTGPLQIKTSAAESYDYSVDSYQKCIKSKSLEKKFDCTINSFSEEVLYDNYNIKIISAAVLTNKDGEVSLGLETENNNSDGVRATIKNISFNNIPVYEYTWTSDVINANKKDILDISLSDLADKYEGEFSDISTVTNISFTFSVGEENGYKNEDSKTINISLPKITLQTNEE